MTAIRRIHDEDPQPTPPAAALALPTGYFTDPNWTPPLAGTLHQGEAEVQGLWGYQRPAPLSNARPLRDQFLRTYPNRAFPVAFTSDECARFSGVCRAYRDYYRDEAKRAAQAA